ncbi:hypothetical protein FM104_12815 [Microbacterium esteraromaticum]|uniref:Uncharacterized protein n=1 Tax=Microbacterium esteraromaticum TaxID=57043 RepID=A0A1R4KHD7_9MICO|nr:hypothetical protein FM104_12815 [Microbacterium esteraromaticum]
MFAGLHQHAAKTPAGAVTMHSGERLPNVDPPLSCRSPAN